MVNSSENKILNEVKSSQEIKSNDIPFLSNYCRNFVNKQLISYKSMFLWGRGVYSSSPSCLCLNELQLIDGNLSTELI